MTHTPKHRGEPKRVFQITVIESERGWGRAEWIRDYDTREEAAAAIVEINKLNTALHAPDYYIRALDEIKEVTL